MAVRFPRLAILASSTKSACSRRTCPAVAITAHARATPWCRASGELREDSATGIVSNCRRANPLPLVRIAVFARGSFDTNMLLPIRRGSTPMLRILSVVSVIALSPLGVAHAQRDALDSVSPSPLPVVAIGPYVTLSSPAPVSVPSAPASAPWPSSTQPPVAWPPANVGPITPGTGCIATSSQPFCP